MYNHSHLTVFPIKALVAASHIFIQNVNRKLTALGDYKSNRPPSFHLQTAGERKETPGNLLCVGGTAMENQPRFSRDELTTLPLPTLYPWKQENHHVLEFFTCHLLWVISLAYGLKQNLVQDRLLLIANPPFARTVLFIHLPQHSKKLLLDTLNEKNMKILRKQ